MRVSLQEPQAERPPFVLVPLQEDSVTVQAQISSTVKDKCFAQETESSHGVK